MDFTYSSTDFDRLTEEIRAERDAAIAECARLRRQVEAVERLAHTYEISGGLTQRIAREFFTAMKEAVNDE